MEDIEAQVKALVGLFGAAVSAVIGLLSRHAVHTEGFSWKRVLIESPVAAFSAIMAGAIGQFMGWDTYIVFGIAGAIAYMSPAVVFQLLQKYFPPKG